MLELDSGKIFHPSEGSVALLLLLPVPVRASHLVLECVGVELDSMGDGKRMVDEAEAVFTRYIRAKTKQEV